MTKAVVRAHPPTRNAIAKNLLILLSLWPVFAVLPGCGKSEPLTREQAYVFGTLVEVSVYGEEKNKAEAATSAVLARFDQLHHKLHAWLPSDLDRLNTALATPGKRATVDEELSRILLDAGTFSHQTEGLFNPAIGNLIRLWGFQSDTPLNSVPPDGRVAEQVRLKPGMHAIHVQDHQVWSDNPAVRLDLGGYAKGYALDEAADILKRQGIHNALINIGGNVLALGSHGSRPWQVGIQHPRQPGVIATLGLADGQAIGTSGDYQRYFEAGGKRYCHLIDPRTGRPADGMQSVTIVVDGKRAGVRSDVLTKPLFIAGVPELQRLSRQLNLSHVLAVDRSGQVWVSRNLLPRLKWTQAKPLFRTI
jgi:thiamine biosynthesis lipoprotein